MFIKDINELGSQIHCLITGLDMRDVKNNEIYRLDDCNHIFMYRALLKVLSIQNKSIYNYFKCPYCMADINSLDIIIDYEL